MSSTLSLILEDLSTNFTYGPRNWIVDDQPFWYGGTSTSPHLANAQAFVGSIEVTFEGTSIAFTGSMPTNSLSQSITVSIDGGTPDNTSCTSSSYLQWYQSPTLSEGTHIIKVDNLNETSLDYATIAVGENTPLSRKKVIVDNDDLEAVHYFGSWIRTEEGFFPGGNMLAGLPFRGSTHRRATPGDTITFRFSGTSVAVYGLFAWGNIGTLAATYTIDGGISMVGSYPVTTSSIEYVNGVQTVPNFLFVSFDSLAAGDHTLVISLTQCVNHEFSLDYITYSPSFASLASMPSLAFTTQTASYSSKKSAVGTIVSGVFGGLMVFAFMAFLFVWLRRRKSKILCGRARLESSNPSSAQLSLWNPAHPSSASGTISPFPIAVSRSPVHFRLSTIAGLKRERNISLSSTAGPSPISPTARSPSSPASPNQTSAASPGSVSPFGVLASDSPSTRGGPPAYEAILAPSPSAS